MNAATTYKVNSVTVSKLNKRKVIFWILAILCMSFIFYFSSKDANVSTQESHKVGKAIGRVVEPDFEKWTYEEQERYAVKIDFPVRKAAHFLEYAMLGTLLGLAWIDSEKKKHINILVPFLIGAMYSVSDELHQLIVSGRAGQLRDVLIDSSGVISGVVFSIIVLKLARFLLQR